MSNETKQIAVENISDYLMISHKDAGEFYEWGLENRFEEYDGIERWVNTKTNNIIHVVHVYELYKQYKETKNLSIIKTTAA